MLLVDVATPAQKEYKRRHDYLGNIVHWKLVKKCNFDIKEKWYVGKPEILSEIKD